MDEQFIAPRELILGGVGIGVALVLLVLLSVLQKGRLRREGAERLRTLEAETGGMADAPAGTTPFFVACYEGGNARFFRVYQSPEELLFVNAGQYFVLIDVEQPRGSDQRHWLLRSMKLIAIALAGGAVAAGIAVVTLLRVVARSAGKNPEAAGDIMLMVLGAIGLMAMVVVVGVPLMLWQVTRRCRQLDVMSLARLRQEAELENKSFRATPETVSEFDVKLLDQRENLIPSQEVGSTIAFKDSVAGRWKITTKATSDTRAAIQAFRSLWGADRVTVDSKLRKRLGESVDEPVAVAKGPARLLERVGAQFKDLDKPSAKLPRWGFPLYMLLGFLAGACVAVAIAVTLSAEAGRFSYTGLFKTVTAVGLGGTYLGHVAGCFRYKELGVNPFAAITPGVLAAGGFIWLLGSAAVVGAVLGVMTVLSGAGVQ